MTRAQRFAAEWLWWVCCAMVSIGGVFMYLIDDFKSDLREGAMLIVIVGLAVSIPLYLVTGAIRLTLWALVNVHPDEEHPFK